MQSGSPPCTSTLDGGMVRISVQSFIASYSSWRKSDRDLLSVIEERLGMPWTDFCFDADRMPMHRQLVHFQIEPPQSFMTTKLDTMFTDPSSA